MIIDAHTHIHPSCDGFGSCHDASVFSLMEQIRSSPASKAVVLALSPIVSNEFVAEACEENPDVFVGFASVDLESGPGATEEQLRIAVDELGLRGLKLHPRVQRFDLSALPQLIPLVKCAKDLKIPILIDAFPSGKTVFSANELEIINCLAENVPEAKIIIAHAGGHRYFDAMMVAKAHRNLYVDLSFTPNYYKGTSVVNDLVFVVRKLGAGRLIFGSDHPEVSTQIAYQQTVDLLNRAKFSSEEQASVMGGNIESLITLRKT